MQYLVTWQIDIEADSPQEAAARALIIQRDNDPANTATVFDVTKQEGITHLIDLSESREDANEDTVRHAQHLSDFVTQEPDGCW